ncbi:MAG: aspartyl protease family protein [Saprospiraceae bacterium]|nr:aspartyl protease family protein [Saprospiraceae bacterium]
MAVALILCLISLLRLHSQPANTPPILVMPGKVVRVPFHYENGFIVVNILFQHILPLRFIIDTGAEYTILTQKAVSDLLKMTYDREYSMMGSDMRTVIEALLVRDVDLEIRHIQLLHRDILVTKEDYFQINYFTGSPIHGILGADILSRFVIRIDYKRQLIDFIDPAAFDVERGYEEIPMTLYRNKPFLHLATKIHENTDPLPFKYLLDTGAALPLLLLTNSHPAIHLPDHVIQGILGMGLGGFLTGAIGRVQQVHLATFPINNLVGSFQDVSLYPDTTHLQGRHGILGNLVLDRFDLILDYPRERVFVRPNDNYSDPFPVDRSGLFLISSGFDLSTIMVQDVIPGSPAFFAGIRPGDIIKKYKCWPVSFFGLSGLTQRFRKEAGKKIRLKIKRGRKRLHRHFVLKDYI